ncbi:TIGR02453 family protein [Leptospira perolatii]|uniref:TIGR02453 family protein n=1 Tax=Leptospira perolatii TaxID=2023191 RepID=A0A2M9ZJ94_9LEPT|nr:DUF2461 domain-containing protein [Leptospira perolatii]PJZ68420.1 TIGR02453 family protein [Leptospira perolatii]PJZ72119.1 TIGR02453 family protein [Leptospira perolatii]
MLQKSTLDFLKSLAKNNNKLWFEKNKESFQSAKEDFELMITELIAKLSKLNPPLAHIDPKKCIFRIYRDVRFSKNKDPYKTNFGAAISETGKGLDRALFYLHVQPGNESFLAGGLYMPESKKLQAVRTKILKDPKKWEKLISESKFKKTFGGLSDMKLKTVPRGFAKDHPMAETLKYTSYVVERKLEDATLLSKNLITMCADSYKLLLPFNQYFNE